MSDPTNLQKEKSMPNLSIATAAALLIASIAPVEAYARSGGCLLWRNRFRDGEFVNTPCFTVDVTEGCGRKNRSAQEDNAWLPHIIPHLASPKWCRLSAPAFSNQTGRFLLRLGVRQSRSGFPGFGIRVCRRWGWAARP
jgi:hypothetical protein